MAWTQPNPATNSAEDAQTHCQALAQIVVSATFENIYDAPTMVSEAKLIRHAAELVSSGIKDARQRTALIEAIARALAGDAHHPRGLPDVPVPFTPVLEDAYRPNTARIIQAVEKLV